MGLFDDIVPQQAAPQPKRGNLFDDLIPPKRRPNLFDDIQWEMKAPDGSTVQFPGSMTMEQVTNAMRERFGSAENRRPARGNLFDDLIPQTAHRRRPTGSLFDDLPMEGELPDPQVRGGSPSSQQPQLATSDERGSGFGEGVHAFLGGAIEGVPIVGPYVRSGIEAAATGAHSLFTGTPYDENRERLGTINARISEENSGTEMAGNITGAVGSMIPLGMTALGARALGITGPSLLARTSAAGTSGAAIGGGDAAVRSGGDLGSTAQGAAFGGLLGANAPWAGQAIGAATKRLAEALLNPGSKGRAATAAARALADDDLTPDLARQRLMELGDDAMLADLGPNLLRQAGAIAATPGRGQKAIRSAIAGRQQAAGSRVTQAADSALGQPVDAVAAVDDLIAARSAAAKPLYEAAYAKPLPQSDAIKEALATPAGKSAWARAQKMAANEGIPLDLTAPDVRAIDLTKRALDDMVDVAKRQGRNNEVRILTGLKERMVGAVDEAVPEYAAAREAFAGPTALKDAMEEGQKVFSRSVSPGALRKQMAALSQSEREAFQQGARSQIADMMGTARNDALKARQIFDQGHNREKLRLLIGDEQAEALLQRLDAEKAFTATRDVVTGNSETAARMAAQKELGGGAASENEGIIRSLLNLRFGDALAKGGDMVTKGARTSRQANMRDRLAEILTRGPRSPETIEYLIAAQQRRALAERLGGQAGRVGHLGVMGTGQVAGR